MPEGQRYPSYVRTGRERAEYKKFKDLPTTGGKAVEVVAPRVKRRIKAYAKQVKEDVGVVSKAYSKWGTQVFIPTVWRTLKKGAKEAFGTRTAGAPTRVKQDGLEAEQDPSFWKGPMGILRKKTIPGAYKEFLSFQKKKAIRDKKAQVAYERSERLAPKTLPSEVETLKNEDLPFDERVDAVRKLKNR